MLLKNAIEAGLVGFWVAEHILINLYCLQDKGWFSNYPCSCKTRHNLTYEGATKTKTHAIKSDLGP